jgi:hypothetical protein
MSVKSAAVFVLLAAILAAGAPLSVSAASVFLFAGPHNWLEARYLAARMPARWGQRTPFFVAALVGVSLLSLSFSLIPVDRSLWHTILVSWILALVRLERRDLFPDALPLGLLWIAAAWYIPQWMDLILVYLHPAVALWFVRRQFQRSHPEYLPAFRLLTISLPVLAFVILAVRLQASLPQEPWLAGQPASFLTLPAAPALIAVHVFLELLHYGVWVFLLPMTGLAQAPWNLRDLPRVRHRLGWPRLTTGLFGAGALLVVVLWLCFATDYNTTRNVYFGFAVIHVLAEAPFLIWLR